MNPSNLATPMLRPARKHPEPENPQALRDTLRRPLHDLRISVIDRCNFRCSYCMPENEYAHNYTFLKKQQWLTFNEIVRLAGLFVDLGVSKIRITGGEPLLRPDLEKLIHQLSRLNGIADLALTTNGALLSKQAVSLRQAGLKRITVSLDTIDETVFHQMNGNKGKLKDVLSGIQTAKEAGFQNIKINVVVQKGVNDRAVLDLAKYFRGTGHIVRFIEYMDVGTCNNWRSDMVVSSTEILKMIHEHFPLTPVDPGYHGEVAARYQYVDGQGEIGFISSVTQPFCGTCTRARISTDGKFYTCLFAGEGKDLKTPLREGKTDKKISGILRDTWRVRGDRYSEERTVIHSSQEKRKKIEMYQIGG